MRFLMTLVAVLSLSFTGYTVAEEEEKKTIGYFEMKPSIVVNIQGKGKYMRCDVQLMTRDDTHLSAIETHAPALRHELLMLFGEQKGEDLKAPKGKEKLRVDALNALQGIMQELTGEARVDDLYFTAFYVQ